MRIARRRDALLAGVALILGCALTPRRAGSADADTQPCSVSAMQLGRAPERTLYDVLERLCPAVARAHRRGYEVRVFVLRSGEPVLLGNATALRTLHPSQAVRVRFLPHVGRPSAGTAVVLIEPRER